MTKPKVHTEASICSTLNNKYNGNSRYKLSNAFVFKQNWESDFFVLKENGYSYEFEVKISRSDFLNDKKKVDKHLILETGKYISIGSKGTFNTQTKIWDYKEVKTEVAHEYRPNKFYYVVPAGMISIDEIPAYAGLMYIDDYSQITTVKEAPFIHKLKLDYEQTLCGKFYAYWINCKNEIRLLKQEVEYLKRQHSNQ